MNIYKGRQTWVQKLPAGYPVTYNEVAARALIVHDNKVLLAYEADTETWLSPGGRLTPGETLLEALAREVAEETALEVETGALLCLFDVLMPRKGCISHKFEFIFAARPTMAPNWIERDHVDGDQNGSVVTKLRWFTREEVAALPRVFPEFLRDWPSLLKENARTYYGTKAEEGYSLPFPMNRFYISTRLVTKHEEKVLLVSNRDGKYWYGPGGQIELGEELQACVVRELREETGLEGSAGEVIAVDEFFSASDKLHQINLYTRCTLNTTKLPENWQDVGSVGKSAFFTRDEHAALPRAYPQYMAELAWPLHEERVTP